jgi:succinylarginine dihydrolase
MHRAVEAADTAAVLRAIFANRDRFCVHDPLPAGASLSDEGAANHTRLCPSFERQGLEVFVFGQSSLDRRLPRPARFPARQTLEACQAIARHHRLDPDAALFIQQNPAAIDAGVFHNDVICVGNAGFLLWHEEAFADGEAAIDRIRAAWQRRFPDSELCTWRVGADQLSLEDAVNSYLFNSQLLTLPGGRMLLLCPSEVSSIPAARRCAEAILAGDNPVTEVRYVNLRESMDNGGGPACLRLRVVLTEDELAAVHPGVLFTPELARRLEAWIQRHYREELRPEDLRDPRLADEITVAFEDLAAVLDLPRELFGL